MRISDAVIIREKKKEKKKKKKKRQNTDQKQKIALFRANKHQEKSILSNCHKSTYHKSKMPEIQK